MIIDLVVDGLAAHRLTRLATADTITEPARRAFVEDLVVAKQGHALTAGQREAFDAEALVAFTDDPPALATLITCRWCAGIWISAGIAVARIVAPTWWRRVARMLAVASAAALLASLED